MTDTTLHRSSTPAEIATVKRRAAPKLFRTRRLANGQIIHTRAGPAVEAKAREIRDNIAESRRHRTSVSSIYSAGSYEDASPVPATPAYIHSSLPSALYGRADNVSARKDSLAVTQPNRLADITEGIASHDVTAPYDEERRDSDMSLCDGAPVAYDLSPPFTYGHVQIVHDMQARPLVTRHAPGLPPHMQLQMPPTPAQQGRAFQSCPASIHTTPIPSRMALAQVGWPTFTDPFPASIGRQVDVVFNTGHDRIAAPAAPSPFAASNDYATPHITQYPLSPSSGEPSNFVSWTNTPVNGTPQIMAHSFEHSLPPQQNSFVSMAQTPLQIAGTSWESHDTTVPPHTPGLGTIDPRWVSPLSSLWSTPAATPRVGSPIHQGLGSMPASYAPPLEHGVEPSPNQSIRVYGTQSYPPGSGERRRVESPPVPIYDHKGYPADRSETVRPANDAKQEDGLGHVFTPGPNLYHPTAGNIGGGQWFQ